jgi:cytoskeleton-associated protein 5
MLNRDDLPIGGRDVTYTEFSDPSATSESDNSGPLETRVTSKTWSVRSAAYKEVATLFTQGQTPSQFLVLLPKFIGDSNPAAQEAALSALAAVLEVSPEAVLGQAGELASAVVEKAMASAKPTIKQAASDTLMKLVAVHSGEPTAVQGALAAAFANKNLKVQSAAAAAYSSLLANFGPQYLALKTFVPLMEALASSSNAGARADAANCFKEAYRWVRDAILPAVDRLKKVQADELKRAFEEITETPTKLLFMRHESSSLPKAGGIAVGGRAEAVRTERAVDDFDLSQPKDIFTTYNEAWTESVLELSKWADKKQALDTLNAEADVPRLAERNPVHLVGLAKRLVLDANFNVQMQAVRLCGLLARGQRRYFETYAKQLLPLLVGKFKEKKAPMVQEAHTALLSFLKSISIEDMLDDLRGTLNEKTPGAKINCALWIAAAADQVGERVLGKVGRTLIEMISKNANDSAGDVRAATQKVLQELTAKTEGGPGLPEARQEAKVEESKREVRPARPLTSKPRSRGASATPKAHAPASKRPGATQQSGQDDEVSVGVLSGEDAEAQLQDVLPGGILSGLSQAGWKDKSQALGELLEWIRSSPEAAANYSEAIVRVVKYKLKEWKENNFTVNKAALECIAVLAAQSDLSKRTASYILTAQALEMLGDVKLTAAYVSCLLAISEVIGPRFVAAQIVKYTAECSKPKVVAESCNALARLVSEYGAHTMTLKDLIDYGKTGVNNANPTIKKAAQTLLVTLYSYLGDALVAQLSDVKEATLKVLAQEFSQTQVIREQAFKVVRGEETKTVDARAALEAGLPRADISSKITSRLLGEFTDSNWKTRKGAMDAVQALLEEHGMRVQAAGLKDLAKALSVRLSDSNKSLVRSCLSLVKLFAEALGPECREFGRFIVPCLLSSLADKQTLVRQEALAAVDKWAQEGGAEVIIGNCYSFLQQDSPELRTELLQWLLNHKADLATTDLSPFFPGVLACLQDRVSGIRAAAETLLGEIIEKTGFDALTPHLKSVKPAVLNALKPVLDKYKGDSTADLDSLDKTRPATAKPPKPTPRAVGKSPSRPLTAKSSTPVARRAPSLESFTITSKGGSKDKRLDLDCRSRLSVEELREEVVERTKECLRQSVSPDLFTQLFSPDFKKQCLGLKHLGELTADLDHAIEILDVILRYFYIRLMESSNTQVTKAILELIAALLASLAAADYTLHEAEASVLIPILCEKSGQNSASFRQQFRALIVSCVQVFPPGRVFSYVLQGLSSKNARSKVECLEALATLVQQQGLAVGQPKDYKIVVRFVSNADSNVRSSAVNVLAEAFKLAPEKIWQLVGEVTDKTRDILDQRFKTISGSSTIPGAKSKSVVAKNSKLKLSFEPSADVEKTESPRALSGRSDPYRRNDAALEVPRLPESPQPSRRQVDFGLLGASSNPPSSAFEISQLQPPKSSKPLHLNLPLLSQKAADESKIPDMPMDICLSNDDLLYDSSEAVVLQRSKTELDMQIEILCDGDLSNRVDALVKINEMIASEEHREDLRAKSDLLLDALSRVMVSTFDRQASEVPLLFAKYFLNVLHKVCSTKVIMREASESVLYSLTEQLLLRLLTEGLDKLGKGNEGEVMLKMMNGAMLRILELSHPTKIFVVLFQLLTRYKGNNSKGKLNTLVIRCLIKLTKVLPSIIQHLEVDRLLVNMHEYLTERAYTEEAGCKAVKTVLHELVKLQQEDIWDAYEAVRRHRTPDQFIEGWLRANLMPSVGLSSPRSRGPLVSIFQRLTEPENYSEAIRELSDYQLRNADASLASYLEELPGALSEKVSEDLQILKPHEDKEAESNFRIQEFQSRLAVMKKKYGLATNTTPAHMSNTLTDLKAKVSSLLGPSGDTKEV